jgi:hypothetical protein
VRRENSGRGKGKAREEKEQLERRANSWGGEERAGEKRE